MSEITYLEASEEITGVIDRLRHLPTKVATLVVPKGAVLLQSLVNLKLLERQAKALGKEVRIVTSDRMGRHLAAQVGLPVYASLDDLQSGRLSTEAQLGDIVHPTHHPVGEAVPVEVGTSGQVQPASPEPTPLRPSRRPRLLALFHLPAGRRKRVILIGGGVLAFLLLLLLFIFILPTATVALTPKADPLEIEQEVLVDTSARAVSISPIVIPGKSGERTLEGSSTQAATGQKNAGAKAGGSVTVKNCAAPSEPGADGYTLASGSTL